MSRLTERLDDNYPVDAEKRDTEHTIIGSILNNLEKEQAITSEYLGILHQQLSPVINEREMPDDPSVPSDRHGANTFLAMACRERLEYQQRINRKIQELMGVIEL